MMSYTMRETCRACNVKFPEQNILDLGAQTIVDFLRPGEKGRGEAPLQLVQCGNSTCKLLQLRHTVDWQLLYKKFWYRSGINEQMRAALNDVVKASIARVDIKTNDAVLDIGSNDGTMLNCFKGNHVRIYGFEPAEELAIESRKFLGKADIRCALFNQAAAKDMLGPTRKFKIITAIAMFYDLDNPNQFLEDVREVLHDEGIFVVQMNYLSLMLRNLAFDNIGHEHLCYYSMNSLVPLFQRNGLKIVDVEMNDVNGGSFRVYAVKANHKFQVQETVDVLLTEEKEHLSDRNVRIFGAQVRNTARQLNRFIRQLKEKKERIYAYGASTRGSTLLQTVFVKGEAEKLIDGVAERDEYKIGRITAGTNLKIVSEQEARENADYFLLLPYHFWESICHREKTWMICGGKFIIPIPYPRIITMGHDVDGSKKMVPVVMNLAQAMAAEMV
jgi:NDP-4-keto-2,6-dideoxyhexose 3-C-methyltransferase